MDDKKGRKEVPPDAPLEDEHWMYRDGSEDYERELLELERRRMTSGRRKAVHQSLPGTSASDRKR